MIAWTWILYFWIVTEGNLIYMEPPSHAVTIARFHNYEQCHAVGKMMSYTQGNLMGWNCWEDLTAYDALD